jgi:hypothetical protein
VGKFLNVPELKTDTSITPRTKAKEKRRHLCKPRFAQLFNSRNCNSAA